MTIHLIRHGKAGDRHDADPDDHRRHLSVAGRAQADRIAALLCETPVVRVVSSSADRCVETVTPLAEAVGLSVEIRPELFEGVSIEASWALLESVIESLGVGEDAVLCSHGDIIPDLVRRAQHRGAEISGPTGWSKGSVWTLECAGPEIVRASYATVPAD